MTTGIIHKHRCCLFPTTTCYINTELEAMTETIILTFLGRQGHWKMISEWCCSPAELLCCWHQMSGIPRLDPRRHNTCYVTPATQAPNVPINSIAWEAQRDNTGDCPGGQNQQSQKINTKQKKNNNILKWNYFNYYSFCPLLINHGISLKIGGLFSCFHTLDLKFKN